MIYINGFFFYVFLLRMVCIVVISELCLLLNIHAPKVWNECLSDDIALPTLKIIKFILSITIKQPREKSACRKSNHPISNNDKSIIEILSDDGGIDAIEALLRSDNEQIYELAHHIIHTYVRRLH